MRIAICDDEKAFLKKFRNEISEILNEADYELTEFTSGENLLEMHKEQKYDIIILDIEMTGINGLDTAREIRKSDRSAVIAFLTSYESFAVQGYEVKAERYILKQQPSNMYKEQLESLFNEYRLKHKMFVYNNVNKAFSARLSNIQYFEVYVRTIIVHVFDGDNKSFDFYGKLSELEGAYAADGFVRVGKSYLVNISNIKHIDKDGLYMMKGDYISMGRSVRAKVIEAYMDYLSGR